MANKASLAALPLLIVLNSVQVPAQVINQPRSGLLTAQGILISGVDAMQISPSYQLTYLSAQDVNGDGKIDLVAGLPSVTNGDPVSTILMQNGGSQNFTVTPVSASSYCLPSYTNNIDPPAIQAARPFCTLSDLNGDGKPDRIFASETINASKPTETDNPTIGVAYATGPGTYSAVTNYVVGGSSMYISSVAVGDFNGDGLTDIAVLRNPQTPPAGTSLLVADVILLIANGHGGFTISSPVSTGVFRGYGPFPKLASLDLNDDGKSDLVVYDGSGDSEVGVLFGTSTGLSKQANIPISNSTFEVFGAGDLNHDGYGDLVVTEEDGVHILLGGPSGHILGYFASDQLLALNDVFNQGPLQVVVGDFNGDGMPDLAVADWNDVTIFQQGSNGSFNRLQQYPGGGIITAADFDGDGRLDLAVGGNPVNILYGIGNGYFQGAPITSNNGWANSVVSGDFNHDGITDVATTWTGKCTLKTRTCTEFVNVFLGSGLGRYLPPVNYSIPVLQNTNYVAGIGLLVGDVNHDGNLDLVAINTSPGSPDTAVLLGKGDGTFSAAKGYTLGTQGNGLLSLADMDNDGNLDIVTGIGIAYGNHDGTFNKLVDYPFGPVGYYALGDVNGDGRLDIVSNETADTVAVHLGATGRSFTTGPTLSVTCDDGCSSGLSLALGKLNGDNKLDLAAASETEVFTFLGNGDGSFRASEQNGSTSLILHYQPPAIYVQDLNGDGINDVIIGPKDGILQVDLGNGDGTLGASLQFAVDSIAVPNPFALNFGHFDAGPSLDIIAPAGAGFARYLNTGYSTWPSPSSIPH